MLIDNIKIEILPARAGDCILIEFIKEDYRILLDGGYVETYHKYLRKKLKKIREQGKKINLLVITHIDSDHIGGIVALLKENGSALNPKIIEIDEVWYNAFNHMNPEKVQKNEISYTLELMLKANVAETETEQSFGKKDISMLQGNTVVKLLVEGRYKWNSLWDGKAVCITNGEYKYLTDNICCRLLNPGEKELQNLAKEWIKKLKSTVKNVVFSEDILFSEAFESFFKYNTQYETKVKNISFSSEYEENKIDWSSWIESWSGQIDESKTNRSSIAFILEYQGKKLLFPGDCPIQLFYDKLPNKIDVVKLPHHGSEKNINKEFIKNTEVEFYILSTDGKKYEHPGKVVIANILHSILGRTNILMNYAIPILKDIGVFVGDKDE